MKLEETTGLDYVSEFHENLSKAKVIMAYNGILSPEMITAFLMRLKKDIEETSFPKAQKKRFYSIVVECVQNLSKHGKVDDNNDKHFLILVEKDKETLKISTGNVIRNDFKESLSDLINDVNDKNSVELQQLYREGVKTNILSENGEAGLGLIDIARKSSDKLQYKFNPIDDNCCFFLFQTQINIA